MRVADYLAEMLVRKGVDDVFIVTGGGLMFMTDGLACNKDIHTVPCLHEQAASMAAISYAQYRGGYGACYVTTGCGGTNAVTGVLHAWQDHVPVVYVSGQCNRDEMMCCVPVPVRAIGQQEADIVSIVKTITKYAVTIMDPHEAIFEIEKAFYLAMAGCAGPVWLDIPLDVQEAIVDPAVDKHYIPVDDYKTACTNDEITYVRNALDKAVRPLVVVGQGVRLAHANSVLGNFIETSGIPMVGTRLGWDIYPYTSKYNIGLADIRGQRAANFALQNADCILCVGTRLSLFTTGYNYNLFARCADEIIVVDIDPIEHKKGTVRITKEINADAKQFLEQLTGYRKQGIDSWIEKCNVWKKKWLYYPENINPENQGISKFAFIRELNAALKADSVIVTDAGATTEIPMQALEFSTSTQRYLGSATQCEMGYALPASIGASIAKEKGEVFCIVGDGSLQMNIQELQTMVTQRLPIKVFVWNNGGYRTIYGHQKGLFNGRFVGVDPASGTAFPDLRKIADAYGIEYCRIDDEDSCHSILTSLLARDSDRLVICEVICWKDEINPQVKAKMRLPDGRRVAIPMEDMYPLLSREELLSELLVPPYTWW
ncbi:MAG: thiamine pyrophosphate-binding protein [Sphaerochaetaceae bacterium]|nr:thiamine pyrophosphate-binding protein [Sphaerochaetaceae bacterium]